MPVEEDHIDVVLQAQADLALQDWDRESMAAEIERLQALLEGRFKDVRLVELRNGELVLKGTLFEHMAEFMAQMLYGGREDKAAANYTETILNHPELGRLTLTLQRQTGQTPHELRRQAEAERDRVQAELSQLVETAAGIAEAAAPLSREIIANLTAAQILQNLCSVERSRTAHTIADHLRSLSVVSRVTAGEWVDTVMRERGMTREDAEMELSAALATGLRPDADFLIDPPARTPGGQAWDAERRALIEALHDAICRPKGVVPDSAAPWYDPRIADDAEARRPRTVL